MNEFTNKVNSLYRQLQELGDEARKIITDFVGSHGGMYSLDIENDDLVFIGDDIYATAIKADPNGNILVHNSAQYSTYLHDMGNYDILELAVNLSNK